MRVFFVTISHCLLRDMSSARVRSHFSWRATLCHHSLKELQSLDVEEEEVCRGGCERELSTNCLRTIPRFLLEPWRESKSCLL